MKSPLGKFCSGHYDLVNRYDSTSELWPCICSICRSQIPLIIFSFITYNWIFKKSNTTCAFSGAGTAYSSWAPKFTSIFSEVRVTRSLGFYVMSCRSFLSFHPFPFRHWIVSFGLRFLVNPLLYSNFSLSKTNQREQCRELQTWWNNTIENWIEKEVKWKRNMSVKTHDSESTQSCVINIRENRIYTFVRRNMLS